MVILVNLWCLNFWYLGWLMVVGLLWVLVGVIWLWLVWMCDSVYWSWIWLVDCVYFELWEFSVDGEWIVWYMVVVWLVVCLGLCLEVCNGCMLLYVIELDGQFCGQLIIGNVIYGVLWLVWIGYWVLSVVIGGGVVIGVLVLGFDYCFGLVMLY